MEAADRKAHWDDRYRSVGATDVSWFAPEPTVTLALLDELAVEPSTSVIDVGGGASTLVDHLVELGFHDLTVLDVSAEALAVAKQRVGEEAASWIVADLLRWTPQRRYGLWHDRAVFHFMTDEEHRSAYLRALGAAVEPGGLVVLATFALDGPEMCSGLPVQRYDAAGLAEVLGEGYRCIGDRREGHVTPSGAVQHFTWAVFRSVM